MENKDITLTKEQLQSMLRPRPADGHKGTFGHALIVAGRYGMAGASILAARGCLRSGVGKLTVHIPASNTVIMQISVPEAIVQPDADNTCFTGLTATPDQYDAVAIGPGIGTSPATQDALAALLARLGGRPCILDADALNLLGASAQLMRLVPRGSILTPHPVEFRRMAGTATPAAFAARHGVILVLKGHPTRIFMPDGTACACPWGNNGMGTAGSGDVLTGIIAGLAAQGYKMSEAAIIGVSLHALAGDAAAGVKGYHSLIASDIIDFLPAAFAACRGARE